MKRFSRQSERNRDPRPVAQEECQDLQIIVKIIVLDGCHHYSKRVCNR